MGENIERRICDVIGGCLRFNRKFIAIFILSHALCFQVQADTVNAEWLSTTRSVSMGNVGIATADDAQTAMFYNPAALARTKKTVIEVFNPQVEFGTENFAIGSGSASYSQQSQLKNAAPLLDKDRNKVSYYGASLYPNIHAQNFNFGVLGKAEGTSYVDSSGTLNYKSRYLVIPSMGLSAGALGGRFKLGVAVRGIQITENDRATKNFQGVGYTIDAAEGWGLGLDAGGLLSLPWAALPTIGFVARNIGDTKFAGSAPLKVASGSSVTTHNSAKMTYDAGIAFFPKFARQSVLTFGVDYRDILNHSNTAVSRKVNAGLELSFQKTIYLRAGYGRGYWTGGIGLASKYGSVDIGTYGEEMNATGTHAQESRRVSLRYGSKF